ncbi:MAG: glycosyltransferase [Erysipelotrichaceae bacterium]
MKIAIFTLGTRGDVQPYLALAKTAIQNGHRALICTGQSFQALIESHGVTYVKADSDLMALLETKEGQMVFNNAMAHPLKTKKFLNEVVNPAFRISLDQFYACTHDADVIVYHPKAFAAVDIALARNIPCISMPPVPILYPIEEFPHLALSPTRSLGKRMNRLTYLVNQKAEMGNIKEVNDFRQKTLHLPKRKAGIYTYAVDGVEIPMIYPLSPLLFEEVTSWNGHVVLPGFFFLEEDVPLAQEVVDFLKQGKAPIVFSFSSMPLKNPTKMKTMVEKALLETNNRAIVLVGNSGLAWESNEHTLVIQSAPHSLLFPQALAIVHHGGVGTMAAALRSGKPQFIIPFGVDQPFWAHRLDQMGCAVKPLKEQNVTVEHLCERFAAFESTALIDRAKQLGLALAQEQGTQNALEWIEALVAKGR